MPAYEYRCETCGDRFERRQKMSESPVDACPACGANVKRLISGGAGIVAHGGAPAPSSRPACGMGSACCGGEMRGNGGGCCAN